MTSREFEHDDEAEKIFRAQERGEPVEIHADGSVDLLDPQGGRTGKSVVLHDTEGEYES